MKKPQISVVIPCLNEEHYIDKLLLDLVKQNYKDFEVVVTDSGSNDNTLKEAEKFSKRLVIKTTVASKKGVSIARNNGAAIADGKYLFFMDADSKIPPDLLSKFVSQAKADRLLTARFRADDERIINRILVWCWSSYLYGLVKMNIPAVTGTCIFILKSTHEALEGFDTGLDVGEDMDYAKRARAVNVRCHYVIDTILKTSTRRFDSDGRFWGPTRNVLLEVYRVIKGGKIEKKPLKHEFGHHKKSKNIRK